MCGIYGGFQLRADIAEILKTVKEQLNIIAHRGPDATGVAVCGHSGAIGHVRLSILDTSEAANQPMHAGSQYTLAYNGEIYNFHELKQDLEDCGHRFETSSDTEVVLKSCIEWGVSEASARFNGMFAFALWDKRESVVHLSRDRYGIKPIYYRSTAMDLSFASELKCFGTAEPLTETVLAMILGTPTCTPGTPWRNVFEVEPGRCVSFSIGTEEIRKLPERTWCNLESMVCEATYRENDDLSQREYNERWQQTFIRGLDRCMISDAPLGVGVSGGVDSCLVTAGCCRLSEAVPLFHANVLGCESELKFACATASAFGMELDVAEIGTWEFLETLAEATWANDFPLGYHSNSVPFLAMAKSARRKVKVVLTGEGADELNGGYDFPAEQVDRQFRRHRLQQIVKGLSRVRLGFLADVVHRNTLAFCSTKEQELLRFRTALGSFNESTWMNEASAAYAFIDSPKERALQHRYYLTCKGHLQSLLWRNDRMGMYASIESRFPFLDNDLVTFQLSTPMKFKRTGGNKPSVRWAAKQLGVPDSLCHRKKCGFSVNTSAFCPVSPEFLRGGFVSSVLPNICAIRPESDWDSFYFYLVSVEIWGRLFSLRESLESVAERIRKYSVAAV